MSDLTDFRVQLGIWLESQEKRLGENLIRAGAYILRHSMKIVPVQTGNLRASGYTRHTGSGIATVVEVGYTASYAIYVHEIVDNLHGAAFNEAYADRIAAAPDNDPYWFERGPNQQALFLSTIIVEHRPQILSIIYSGIDHG